MTELCTLRRGCEWRPRLRNKRHTKAPRVALARSFAANGESHEVTTRQTTRAQSREHGEASVVRLRVAR